MQSGEVVVGVPGIFSLVIRVGRQVLAQKRSLATHSLVYLVCRLCQFWLCIFAPAFTRCLLVGWLLNGEPALTRLNYAPPSKLVVIIF